MRNRILPAMAYNGTIFYTVVYSRIS